MSEHRTLTQAVDMLAPLSPMKAADRLTQGVHDNSCRLYCNGKMIPSNIAPRLNVVVKFEKDGRRIDYVTSNFAMGGIKPPVALGGEKPDDVWEFEVDEVMALKPQPDTKAAADKPPERRRGPVVKHDWHGIDAEIARRCIDEKTGRVKVPQSENKLADDVLDWLAKSGKNCPAVSEMREAVKIVCAALRAAQK